jgi:hypothetical protein
MSVSDPPDGGLLKDLGKATGVRLTYVSSITTNLYVFGISDSAPDPDCQQAIERLRKDSRIKSADVDARRRHH